MLILNDGYTFLRYDPSNNSVTVTELAHSSVEDTVRSTYSLPDFLAAITPDVADDSD